MRKRPVHPVAHQQDLIDVYKRQAVNIVMVRGLTTAGDVWFPVMVGIFSQWLVAVLGGWALGDLLGLGLVGIWIAMACDEGLRGALFVVRFRRGTWRKKRLVE